MLVDKLDSPIFSDAELFNSLQGRQIRAWQNKLNKRNGKIERQDLDTYELFRDQFSPVTSLYAE